MAAITRTNKKPAQHNSTIYLPYAPSKRQTSGGFNPRFTATLSNNGTSASAYPSASASPSAPILLAIMDEELRAKRRRELSSQEDFYRLAKEVQNRSGQKLCADSTED
jgi:hypothetical protein